MPNINDINGVTVANLAKLDAVLKANISKVNGLTLAPAFTGLLDTYTGAAAGYSTRRLASSATVLMRIREDVGDTETDIGYDSNGDLDTAAIASHCGSANGYVVTWYDQSGNTNNATQSTASSQPQIYNGTAVITDNGKPAVEFVNGTTQLMTTSYSAQLYPTSAFVVTKATTTTRSPSLTIGGAAAYRDGYAFSHNATYSRFFYDTDGPGGGQSYVQVTANSQNQTLYSVVTDTNSVDYRANGGTSATGTSIYNGSGTLELHNWYTSVGALLQEVLYFPSAKGATDRTGIETNINTHFSIY